MVRKMGLEKVPKQKSSANKTSKAKLRKAKTEAIITGLVLAIIGSIIAGSFEKNTLTNYAGFGMLLVGIAAFVAGACSMTSANVENKLRQERPELCSDNRRPPLCSSIWAVGVGVTLGVIGSLLGNTYAKDSTINMAGFGMLLSGIAVFVLGISSAALGTVRIELSQNKKPEGKVGIPKILLFDIISIGFGVIFLIIGSILAGSFEKEGLMNYAGFGILILGVIILSMGATGTVIAILRFRLNLDETDGGEAKPRIILGSIWAIGIGAMLLINGSLIASSYEKNTLMNNAGFALLLAGTGVFVYGMFETARISTMGYLNKRSNPIRGARIPSRKQQNRGTDFKATLKSLVEN